MKGCGSFYIGTTASPGGFVSTFSRLFMQRIWSKYDTISGCGYDRLLHPISNHEKGFSVQLSKSSFDCYEGETWAVQPRP